MRVLYVIDRGILGGIQRHTQCLAMCLRGVCETAVCIVGDPGPLGQQMVEKGLHVFSLGCKNGHDPFLFARFERVLRVFRPDVVHGQVLPAFCQLWLRLCHPKLPVIVSIHTLPRPTYGLSGLIQTFFGRIVGCRVAYYLPVSQATWKAFRALKPKARGEVFYNPIVLEKGGQIQHCEVVGTVGRFADVKDWPAFVDVAHRLGDVEVWGVGVSLAEAMKIFGKKAERVKWMGPQPVGRDWIARLGLFILTSKLEQMPTVVLECFAERTPICGFVPDGGMCEILNFSSGPLREAFIKERDCEKLASIVRRILDDREFRERLIEDGWRIVNCHFDAMKNCQTMLVSVYGKVLKEASDVG